MEFRADPQYFVGLIDLWNEVGEAVGDCVAQDTTYQRHPNDISDITGLVWL